MQRLAISALKRRTILASATFVILMGTISPSSARSASEQQGAYLLTQSGWAALAAGRYDAALETFESALDTHPRDLEAMAGKARALASIGETRPALKLIQKISPNNPNFLLEHAAIYLIDDQPERALEKVEQSRKAAEKNRFAAGSVPLGQEYDRRLAFMNGENGEALYALGGYYRALEEFRTARKLGSGANASRAIGDAHAALGDYKNAELAFNDAIMQRRHDGMPFAGVEMCAGSKGISRARSRITTRRFSTLNQTPSCLRPEQQRCAQPGISGVRSQTFSAC